MRQWIRSHLTYANVISTLCLFLLLGGGTAVALNGTNTVQSDDLGPGAQVKAPDIASDAVNSADIANGQVKNPDIYDGAVTTNKLRDGSVGNADLGAGSVTGAKVADDSLTGAKVADDSLTGADVNESSLTGNAQALIYNDNASVSPPLTTIATVGPYAIKGQCVNVAGASQARLWVNGPGTADVMFNATLNDSSDQGTHSNFSGPLGANTDTTIASVTASSGTFWRIVGTAMLRTGSTLVQVDFDIVPDFRSSPGTCSIYGTATRAT